MPVLLKLTHHWQINTFKQDSSWWAPVIVSHRFSTSHPKLMKDLGEEFSATANLGDAELWKSKVDPREDCWAAKMLPSGVTGGDPTTPKVVKEDPCDPLVGWDRPKFVKPGGLEGFKCLLFWPKMVKAWLACPPKPTSWPLCLCWPKVVKAWLRCKLVPNEVKEPVVEGSLCLHGSMICIILSWSPLDNYFFETHCIFTHVVQSYIPPHGYCYSSWCDKIFFHLFPRPLRLTSVSGATPSSSLTSPSSFAGFCTCAVCSCSSEQQHLYHRCLYSRTLVSDQGRPTVWAVVCV